MDLTPISIHELDALGTQLLPSRETPSNFFVGGILIGAVNTATSVNAVTLGSLSVANAFQVIRVG